MKALPGLIESMDMIEVCASAAVGRGREGLWGLGSGKDAASTVKDAFCWLAGALGCLAPPGPGSQRRPCGVRCHGILKRKAAGEARSTASFLGPLCYGSGAVFERGLRVAAKVKICTVSSGGRIRPCVARQSPTLPPTPMHTRA